MNTRIAVATLAAAIVLAVLAAGGRTASSHPHVGDPNARVMAVHAFEKPMTLEEIAAKADVIVVGVATSDQIRKFRDNSAIPQENRGPRIYARGAYHDLSFRVVEQVKGSVPDEISVRWLASSPELMIAEQPVPELTVARQYVLFLNMGTGVWVGGYTMLGRRGAGDLIGQQATFAEFGALSLARIREAARSSR